MKTPSWKSVVLLLVVSTVALSGLVVALDALIHHRRETIRQQLASAIGRPVSFDSLTFDVWGGPALSATNVSVADHPRFAATPLVQALEVKMKVRWLDLLRGKLKITSAVLNQPEIQIIRNETGAFNIFKLSSHLTSGNSLATPPTQAIHIRQGKIHYIDRSSKKPEDIEIHEVNLYLAGQGKNIGVDLSGNLSSSERQPFKVTGSIGPLAAAGAFSDNPLDLTVEIGSLPYELFARALPLIEEAIPNYLGISGPLDIDAHISGTLENPRLSNTTFRGAVFNASVPNMTLTADLDFSSKDTGWSGGLLKGELILDPVGFDQIKQMPFLERLLPSALTIEGPLKVHNEIEGRMGDLRVQTQLDGKDNRIRYGEWLDKPAGVPAQLVLVTRRRNDLVSIEDSRFQLFNGTFAFAGSLAEKPERVLRIRMQNEGIELAGWEKVVPAIADYHINGLLKAELSIRKRFSPQHDQPSVLGHLSLAGVNAVTGPRSIGGLTAEIEFDGDEAEIEGLSLQLGSSVLSLKGQVRNLGEPNIQYDLQSPKLHLADVLEAPGYEEDWYKNLTSRGVVTFNNGLASVTADVSTSDGVLQGVSYRDLTGNIEWGPGTVNLSEVSFRAFGGTLGGTATISKDPTSGLVFEIKPTLRDVDLAAFLKTVAADSAGHVEGKLDLQAELAGSGKDWKAIKKGLKGRGNLALGQGRIKNFNLVKAVLAAMDEVPGIRDLTPTGLGFRGLFRNSDTAYDLIEGVFTLRGGRLESPDVLLATPHYSLNAKGWVDTSGTMQWEAALVLSRSFSSELLKTHRNVRYLVDDRSIMVLPFRLEGKFPDIKAQPEVEQLVRFMQSRYADEKKGRRPAASKDTDKASTLWDDFRQNSDELWQSFRQLFR